MSHILRRAERRAVDLRGRPLCIVDLFDSSVRAGVSDR